METKGALKVKRSEVVDANMATVTDTNGEGIYPRGFLHKTLESDTHIPVSKDVRARRALTVVAKAPKFEPVIVTLADDVSGIFVNATELTNGVTYVNALNKDPICKAVVTWNELDLPTPEETENPEDVSDVHRTYRTLMGGTYGTWNSTEAEFE